MRHFLLITAILAIFLLQACSSGITSYPSADRGLTSKGATGPVAFSPKTKPYTVLGRTYYPMQTARGYDEVGTASWYGKDFHGKKTAAGNIYDMYSLSAAHKTLPLGTWVRVTNLSNGRGVDLVIDDRGPFVGDRIIDLSYAAAQQLGSARAGLAKVRVTALADNPLINVASAPARTKAPAPKVVKVRTPAPVRAVANAPVKQVVAQAPKYYIQVGTFAQAQNAQSVVSHLVRSGYGGSRVTTMDTGGRSLYCVQAGAFYRFDQAEKALMKLKRQFPSSFLARV